MIGGGLLFAALAWLGLSVSLVTVLRVSQPEAALTLRPGDGHARAMLAERMILARGDQDAVRAAALTAFANEPTSVRGARLIAALTTDPAAVRPRFGFARQLSRRDLGTTLFFIEEAVRRNDVPSALAQYRVALRTSGSSAPELLFPILDDALTQPDLNRPIGAMMALGDPWVPEFVAFSIVRKTNVAALAAALSAYPRTLAALDDATKARLIGELSDQRQFDAAARLYLMLSRRNPAALGSVRHGDFSTAGTWPPFDWVTTSDGDFGGSLMGADGILQAYARGPGRGSAARQLLRLPAGAYVIRIRTLPTEQPGGGGARWTLSCAAPAERPLGALEVDAGSAAGVREAAVRVPADCGWQWLTLEVAAGSEGAALDLIFDAVEVVPGRIRN